MSYQAIKDLVGYALRTGLIEEYDRPWAVNELLKAMGMDAWEEPAETPKGGHIPRSVPCGGRSPPGP